MSFPGALMNNPFLLICKITGLLVCIAALLGVWMLAGPRDRIRGTFLASSICVGILFAERIVGSRRSLVLSADLVILFMILAGVFLGITAYVPEYDSWIR
jgi:hypothetical protein